MTRPIVLAIVLIGAWIATELWSRRRQRLSAPGVTLFTGPGCRACGNVLSALHDAGLEPAVVDVSTNPSPGVGAVPTVVVGDSTGSTVIRRSGVAVTRDLARLIEAARQAT